MLPRTYCMIDFYTFLTLFRELTRVHQLPITNYGVLMALAFEDLRLLKEVETVADDVWKMVSRWPIFERDTVGKQLVRAVDSIGANIAEAFGRYHYGEKLQFLYYARGSIFESKYWLNRVIARQLSDPKAIQPFTTQLTEIAKQLNRLADSTKKQRSPATTNASTIREPSPTYQLQDDQSDTPPLFSPSDITFLSDT